MKKKCAMSKLKLAAVLWEKPLLGPFAKKQILASVPKLPQTARRLCWTRNLTPWVYGLKQKLNPDSAPKLGLDPGSRPLHVYQELVRHQTKATLFQDLDVRHFARCEWRTQSTWATRNRKNCRPPRTTRNDEEEESQTLSQGLEN